VSKTSSLLLHNPPQRQQSGKILLGGRARILDMPSFVDSRGSLCPIEFPILGFFPVRAFVVTGLANSERGGHGHRKARQLFMLTAGGVDIELRFQGENETVPMIEKNRLLMVEPLVWSRQVYLSEGSTMIVFSDMQYDPEEYFYEM
jgi:hypothetical protein